MKATRPERLERLEDIEATIWRELGRAVGDTRHAWRLGVLATVDGDAADARCVVLRELDLAARWLVFYTDERSPKAAQLDAHPLGTLVLWSEPLGWQLRLRVQLSLRSSGLSVSSRWAKLKMTPAAHDYLSPLPPGSTLDAPQTPVANLERESRAHFALVMAEVRSIDWLELHALGHRRALFDGKTRCWLAP